MKTLFIALICLCGSFLSLAGTLYAQEMHPFVCAIVDGKNGPKVACVAGAQGVTYKFVEGDNLMGFSVPFKPSDCMFNKGDDWVSFNCNQVGIEVK